MKLFKRNVDWIMVEASKEPAKDTVNWDQVKKCNKCKGIFDKYAPGKHIKEIINTISYRDQEIWYCIACAPPYDRSEFSMYSSAKYYKLVACDAKGKISE